MKATNLQIRSLRPGDREVLSRFTCSTREPWEDLVEEQIRGPLPLRYLDTPPYFDGRMLLGFGPAGDLLVVGAHHVEPSMVPDIGYTEVVAVACDARGTLLDLPHGDEISLGHFMLLVIFQQMRRLGRHSRTFVRVDRRNTRSLSLLDRVGLIEERDDSLPELVDFHLWRPRRYSDSRRVRISVVDRSLTPLQRRLTAFGRHQRWLQFSEVAGHATQMTVAIASGDAVDPARGSWRRHHR